MLPRHSAEALRRSLAAFPVVMLTGARQVGKSTLVQSLIGPRWRARYLTLDDRTTLDAALRDPDGFLAGADGPIVVDEVQRAPDLLRAIKLVVDRDRRPGRFLLTGSAHLVSLSRVAETLAGRAAVHVLHPLSWAEMGRRPPPRLIDDLFDCRSASDLLRRWPRRAPASRRAELAERVLWGGFPTPALMRDRRTRRLWFESYRQTYVERDLRDLSDIANLPDFSRLLVLAAMRTGQMLNVSELARTVQLPTTTVRRYMNLLTLTHQVFALEPYAANVGKRLVKTPKLYLTDTGLACHLAVADSFQTLERQERIGPLVETWAVSEMKKGLALQPGGTHLWYWRVQHGPEADLLLERGGEVVAIEVKWGRGISPSDLQGLRSCADALGKRFNLGVLVHSGEEALAIDRRTVAVPFSIFFGREHAAGAGRRS